jgi:hypothetical protein
MKRTTIVATFGLLGLAFAIAPCAALVGCSPHPPPPPPTFEAGPPPSSAEVCLHLAKIGCPEGADDACQRKIDQVAHDRLTIFPLRCWVSAPTREAARACGQLDCSGGPL